MIKTSSGKYYSLSFYNTEKIEILLDVSIKTSGGNRRTDSATKVIYLTDGTLEPPKTTIAGRDRIGIGSLEFFIANSGVSYPNIKYEWKLTHLGRKDLLNLGNTGSVCYEFTEQGLYVISCTATNTKTGKSSTANKNIEVFGGHATKSIKIPDDIFTVTQNNNSLIISTNTNDNTDLTKRNIQIYSYEAFNLLTGTLMDKGSVINGSCIDVSRYHEGIYVLKFENGVDSGVHKFTIK